MLVVDSLLFEGNRNHCIVLVSSKSESVTFNSNDSITIIQDGITRRRVPIIVLLDNSNERITLYFKNKADYTDCMFVLRGTSKSQSEADVYEDY